MESPEQERQRLRQNAMVLALAQAIRSDEIVIDEARQSIGSLTSSEMDWLKEIQRIALQCNSLKQGKVALRPAEDSEPGDIAVHKTKSDLDLRVVARGGRGQVMLIKLNKDKDIIPYMSEHLGVSRLS